MIEYFIYNFQSFMMMFARIFGLFNVAPIFSSESINFPTRVMFSFLITLITFPVSGVYMHKVPDSMGAYALILFSEILIGVLIGFLLSIIFAGFQMAGEYFGVQMGFGYTEVIDPVSQSSMPVISNLKNLMGIMVFLVTGAHRVLIESIVYSFEKIQILKFTSKVNAGIFKSFEYAIGAMFLVAFKIALPVLGILILVTIAEAIMGKTAPQLNIMQLSFPVKILIGIFVLIIIMPFIEKQMEAGFSLSFDRLNMLMSEWPK
jgi:flagellar biosynthetic protein FliR